MNEIMTVFRPSPIAVLSAATLALAGCSALPRSGNSDVGAQRSGSVSSAPRVVSARSEDRTCFAELDRSGATFSALPDRYEARGCSALGAVQLNALAGDNGRFSVSDIGPVRCRTAQTFNAWARFGVDRAARQILGSQLARIETMGSYSCRNVAGSSRRSAHASAQAIDVSAFVLADGRRISVKGDWSDGNHAERQFLRVVFQSACRRFGTVLGPDYNRAHEDHFHLEGTDTQFCR